MRNKLRAAGRLHREASMRRVELQVEGRRFQTDVDDPTSLAVPLEFSGDQSRAFGLPAATSEPISFGSTPCNTEKGGDFNAQSLSLVPHGNGTHTETVGHLIDREVPVGKRLAETLMPCTVVTAEPVPLEEVDESYPNRSEPDDRVITRGETEVRMAEIETPPGFSRSLVLRTHAEPTPVHRDYSDTNPPYPTTELVDWLVDCGVEHLLIDLPSLDREYEGGHLANHRRFWGLAADAREQQPPSPRTITEFTRIPGEVTDGFYFLDIELPDLRTDAAPSRPLLYPTRPMD